MRIAFSSMAKQSSICLATASRTRPGRPSNSNDAAAKKQPPRTEDFRYADLSRAVVQVEFSRGHDSTQGSQGEADDAAETDFSDNTDEEN